MMKTVARIGVAAAVLAVAAAAGCSKRREQGGKRTGDEPGATGARAKDTGGVVKVDGSSTVFLISEAVSVEFRGQGHATVAMSGTGGGFKKLCRGDIEVSGASRPIKASEAKACKDAGIEFIELPVAYDGLAVVVHPKADWVDHLTVAELKKMWEPEAQRKVTSWAQIRDGFPDRKLTLYGAGVDSGTYDYFTQAVVGTEHASRGDFTSNEDDNVLVQGVSGDGGALGFFGYGYYKENRDRLKIVPIDDGKDDNGKGPIAPSESTVNDGTYQPLSRPIFIYVSTRALERDVVARFVEFYLDQAKALAAEVGYIALPDRAYELARQRLADQKTGSLFSGGSQIGVTIDKLLEQESGS
jgi:phosphate transport system substrate-binding protein